MADGDLVLSIKNPGRPTAEDFRLALPPSATVRELKAALQERYPGNPAPTTVTAIYAGRVLKDDNAVLSSFIVPVRLCCLARGLPGLAASSATSMQRLHNIRGMHMPELNCLLQAPAL
jgi:hypothetical protein